MKEGDYVLIDGFKYAIWVIESMFSYVGGSSLGNHVKVKLCWVKEGYSALPGWGARPGSYYDIFRNRLSAAPEMLVIALAADGAL